MRMASPVNKLCVEESTSQASKGYISSSFPSSLVMD